MNKNITIPLGLIAAALVAVVAIGATSGDGDDTPPARSASDRVVRPDSQRLSTAEDGKVTFVEFLDFECEACGAAYPFVEQLREAYDGRVTFVVRHFPLHNNSVAAAKAAEAAGAQGKFEEMYQKLFETQSSWGESSESKEEVFFGFAEDLGLDMEAFKADYDDPATEQKVNRDQADGRALGVQGTPTFFINGDKIEARSADEFVAKLDAELAE